MKKYYLKKKMGAGKKAKAKIALISIITCLVATLICLVTCAFSFHWTWEMVVYWLNPFSEGNNWTWLVYFAVVFLALIIIWLVHRARMEKIESDGR